MRVIQGVLFDIGGVLLTWGSPLIRAVLAEWMGSTSTDLPAVFRNGYRLVETGQLSEVELLARVQRELGLRRAAPEAELAQAFRAGFRPVPAMLRLAAELRQSGLRVGLLSNTQPSHVLMLRAMGVLDGYDSVTLSCEVGSRKPEPEIYRIATTALSVPPAATLFIDDLEANVDGAVAAGLQGLLHRDPDETSRTVRRMAGTALASAGAGPRA